MLKVPFTGSTIPPAANSRVSTLLSSTYTLVSREETEELARRMQLRLYRTSVKEDFNVNEVFRYLSERYLDQMNNPVDDSVRGPNSKSLNTMSNNLRNGHLLKPTTGHRDGTISLHRRLRPSRKSFRRSCALL